MTFYKILNLALILGFALAACSNKKPNPNEEKKLFKSSDIDINGIHRDKMQLQISQNALDRTNNIYSLEIIKFEKPKSNASTINSIENPKSGSIVCKFSIDKLTAARELVQLSKNIGLTVITRPIPTAEEVKKINKELGIDNRDLFFTTQVPKNILTQSNSDLITDSNTVLIVSDVNINNLESGSDQECNFLLPENPITPGIN